MSFVRHRLRGSSASGGGKISCHNLLGVDGSETESGFSPARADGDSFYGGQKLPGIQNLIRSAIGEVSKRPGYKVIQKPDWVPVVYGVFLYKTQNDMRYFIATDGYVCIAYSNFSLEKKIEIQGSYAKCYGFQAGKYMFITNCHYLLIYDCEEEREIFISMSGTNNISEPDMTYLPTTYIACSPSGAGSPYQSVNLLNPFVAEQYIGDGSSREYKVHFPVKNIYGAYIKNEEGEWKETAVTGSSGQTVTFEAPPPKPAITGEDNVRIVYSRPTDLKNKSNLPCCTCAAMFGVGGFEDRLFMSGNIYNQGYVYYSEMNNPLYFPETNYIKVGTHTTMVRALSGQGVNLYVICNDNIYSITGRATADDTDTAYVQDSIFCINAVLESPEAVAVPPVIFDNEINYLTKDGVCAVTASGVLDERCCQIRSSYANRYLKEIDDLSDTRMMTYRDYLIVSDKNGRLYLLDGKQFAASGELPFSRRQYECFIFSNVVARHIWTYGDKLYFSDGTDIFCFDEQRLYDEYTDENGKLVKAPIYAYWETPEIYTDSFHEKKFISKLGVHLGDSYTGDTRLSDTDVKVILRFDRDEWRTVKNYDGKRRSFAYDSVDYSRFTYSDKPKSYGVYLRSLHKKCRSIKLRFENDKLYEPFVLRGFELEYLKM